MSSTIRILPEGVINRIAAGEVVDRPASLVKELLENALDAGATTVEVGIEGAGRRLIRVRDDGCGLSRDDCLLAFERHATSKIFDAEDLWRVRTLGFRGEALPSIAAVSRVDCWTARAGEAAGTHLALEGGVLKRVEDAACAKGFTIAVRRLFYNTPPRLKFLKSDRVEGRLVTAVITHYALAHPDRSFRLLAGDRPLVEALPAAGRRERVVHLFGAQLASELLEVGFQKNGVGVEGFASGPGLHRSGREQQYFFVNGRYVRDRLLLSAVAEAYQTRLPHGRYPVLFLFLELPPEEVDVNVHPAKLEVRFRAADGVREAVRAGLEDALRKASPAAARADWGGPPEGRWSAPGSGGAPAAALLPGRPVAGSREGVRSAPAASGGPPARRGLGPGDLPEGDGRIGAAEGPKPPSRRRGELSGGTVAAPLAERQLRFPGGDHFQVLGQVGATYIVVQCEEGLLIVDQHAAHERLRYEALLREIAAGPVSAQRLAVPLTLPMTPSEIGLAEGHREELARVGYEVEPFGPGTLLVRTVPALWAEEGPGALLTALLGALEREGRLPAGEAAARHLAAAMACHRSVRAGRSLPREAAEALVGELRGRPWLTTCPHGRPLYLLLSMDEMARRFLRL